MTIFIFCERRLLHFYIAELKSEDRFVLRRVRAVCHFFDFSLCLDVLSPLPIVQPKISTTRDHGNKINGKTETRFGMEGISIILIPPLSTSRIKCYYL